MDPPAIVAAPDAAVAEAAPDPVAVLRAAVDGMDPSSRASIDAVVAAIEAVGVTPLDGAAPVLIELAGRPMPPKDSAQRARVAAVAALAAYRGDDVVVALANVIDAGVERQPAAVVGAAINALGAQHAEAALPALLQAMERHPMFFQQVRRAVVGVGPAAKPELRRLLAEGRLDFSVAILIGDMHDVDAVDDLVAALDRPAVPAYVDGPVQHVAILDALRKIGSPRAAARVLAIAADPGTKKHPADLAVRSIAASAYGLVSVDGREKYKKKTGLQILAARAADDHEDDALRFACADSLGRLASDLDDAKALRVLARRYADAAERKRDVADQLKDAEPDKAEEDRLFAAAYHGFERGFENHLARVEVAARCAGKVDCLLATFTTSAEDAYAQAKASLPASDDWTDDEKADLRVAQIERAMLELRRLGPAAAPATDTLLDAIRDPANAGDRLIRQAVLLALPAIAPLPCDACVTDLGALVAAEQGQAALAALTYETELAIAYFTWAGR